jgi:hypothetical protein
MGIRSKKSKMFLIKHTIQFKKNRIESRFLQLETLQINKIYSKVILIMTTADLARMIQIKKLQYTNSK